MSARTVVLLLAVAASSAAACDRPSGGSKASPPEAGPAPTKAAHVRVIAPGDAPADLASSHVSLSVIKDRDLTAPVTARLSLVDGAVALASATPSAHLTLDLDSFDSGIPIRNERVRNLFFETSSRGWDTAEISIPSIPSDVVTALRSARHVENAHLEGHLRVHGHTAGVALVVDASYADDGRLSVKTSSPAEVKISDLGLRDNQRRLSAVCMHDSIDDVVKIEAVLEFSPPR